MQLTLDYMNPQIEKQEEEIPEVTDINQIYREMNRVTREIYQTISTGDKILEVSENLDSCYQAVKNHSAETPLLAVIDGPNGELRQLMGWKEIPEVTDENREEITEAVLESFSATLKRMWDAVIKFFAKMLDHLKDLVKWVYQYLMKTEQRLEQEQKRVAKVKNPNRDISDVVSSFTQVTVSDKGLQLSRFDEIIETMFEFPKPSQWTKSIVLSAIQDLNAVSENIIEAVKKEDFTGLDMLQSDMQHHITQLETSYEYNKNQTTKVPGSSVGLDQNSDVLDVLNDFIKFSSRQTSNIKSMKELRSSTEKMMKTISKLKGEAPGLDEAGFRQLHQKFLTVQRVYQSILKFTENRTGVFVEVSNDLLGFTEQVVEDEDKK